MRNVSESIELRYRDISYIVKFATSTITNFGGGIHFARPINSQWRTQRNTCPKKQTHQQIHTHSYIQYIPRNMHTVFALLCFVVVIHRLIFPYPSGLLHWHCGNLTIAPVPAKQPWWIWINTSCEFIMNDCITTTKQSTTKPCAYFLGYTVDDCISMYHCFNCAVFKEWLLCFRQQSSHEAHIVRKHPFVGAVE